MRRPAFALVLLLAACSREESAANRAAGADSNAIAPAAAPGAPTGCADRWAVTLDRESFAKDRNGNPVPSDRIRAFEASAAPAVRTAVNEACAAGEVNRVEAAAIRTLVITNDTDRDTPKFYADEADRTRTSLNDSFVARDFAIPSEMELRQGMQCLTSMDSQACKESIQ